MAGHPGLIELAAIVSSPSPSAEPVIDASRNLLRRQSLWVVLFIHLL